MSNSNPNEIWQIKVDNEVYEADFQTVVQWIAEGRLMPTDQVKKGNLNWNEAGKVPVLRKVFAGEAPPPTATTPNGGESNKAAGDGAAASGQPYNQNSYQEQKTNYKAGNYHSNTATVACVNHPEMAPRYVCGSCQAHFCQHCAKTVGTSGSAICERCGELCHSYSSHIAMNTRQQYQNTPFGFQVLKPAIMYPFRDPTALIIWLSIYGFLCLAQQIAIFGSGLARAMATAMMFGCMSLIIQQIAAGQFNRSFLPDFTDGSFREQVISPLRLSAAVMLITFLPAGLLIGAASYGFIKIVPASIQRTVADETEDSEDAEVSSDTSSATSESVSRKKVIPDATPPAASSPGFGEQFQQFLLAFLPYSYFFVQFIVAGGFLFILIMLAIGWVVVYYPMALIVAGFTQDVWSVLNPAVGIDTMRRMGPTYFQAFMVFAVVKLSWVVAIGFLTPLQVIPFLGGIVINVIAGVLGFYINLVGAYVLGMALYKCADQLGIATD